LFLCFIFLLSLFLIFFHCMFLSTFPSFLIAPSFSSVSHFLCFYVLSGFPSLFPFLPSVLSYVSHFLFLCSPSFSFSTSFVSSHSFSFLIPSFPLFVSFSFLLSFTYFFLSFPFRSVFTPSLPLTTSKDINRQIYLSRW
jgi:hypothetical protein